MKITLCGSTKFREAFQDWNIILTLAGHIVYSVAGFGHSGDVFDDEEKRRLDVIHLEKIAQSDAILVLNVNQYYGESTTREIDYAKMLGREVYWLHNKTDGGGCLGKSIWTMPHQFMLGTGFKSVSHVSRSHKYMELKADDLCPQTV